MLQVAVDTGLKRLVSALAQPVQHLGQPAHASLGQLLKAAGMALYHTSHQVACQASWLLTVSCMGAYEQLFLISRLPDTSGSAAKITNTSLSHTQLVW